MRSSSVDRWPCSSPPRGRLDPATALLLAGAAQEAREVDRRSGDAEGDLTPALRAAFADADLVDLASTRSAGRSLELAASCACSCPHFLNDIVRRTNRSSQAGGALPRRIAGHAPWPQTRNGRHAAGDPG